MYALLRTSLGDSQPFKQCVVLFGSGLIGSQVLKALHSSAIWETHRLPYAWNDASLQKTQREHILEFIKNKFQDNERQLRYFDFVWCAGKAGFSAGEDVFEAEHDVFVESFKSCEGLVKRNEFAIARCHLVSSAGGLFEGQMLVNANSKPAPKRPYGHAKLKLEHFIQSECKSFIPFIYRPSSVYGYTKPGSRIGLIVALLNNAIQNKESTIYGQPSTLRDFVLADDIGKFMSQKIMGTEDQDQIFTLAAGKPSAMIEVISHIRAIEDKELLLRYVLGGTNTLNNTFNASILPSGWQSTPLEIGIAKVSDRIKAYFHT